MHRSPMIARLEARLARRFEIVTEPVPVGPLRVQFTRVRDPEAVLDDLCRKIDTHERVTGKRVQGDQLGLPYWAELWDSAIGVGVWLVNQEGRWKSAPVLDLGCGMGLAGTVAAMLGAHVTFGDIETDCLLFSLLNGRRYSEEVFARRINWQTDRLEQRYDLIIGSDVLYDKTQWEHLDPFFRHHLSKSGRIILGEPGRQTGELFVPWIQQRGWALHQTSVSVPTRPVPIKLFELSRS